MAPQVPTLRPSMHEDYQRTLALDNASEIHAVGMNHFEISICESHFPPPDSPFRGHRNPLGEWSQLWARFLWRPHTKPQVRSLNQESE